MQGHWTDYLEHIEECRVLGREGQPDRLIIYLKRTIISSTVAFWQELWEKLKPEDLPLRIVKPDIPLGKSMSGGLFLEACKRALEMGA